MTPADAARLLGIAAIFDRRTIGETEARAWADALDELDPRDCAEAIRSHYRDSSRWIMPADVRDRIAQARRTAADHARNQQQKGVIEGAKETTSSNPHQRYLEATQLVRQRRQELGYIEDPA